MPDIIHLLPDAVANQIAAGEVIQRPASAIKELIENSIDAGASSIKVILREAGKSLLQVVDNGSGMSETDARMSIERHATSKIRKADDLFSIRTMGFRGEAMASIAAIAQVELKTKRKEDELGTLLLVEGSEVKKHEPCSCANGTSISVKNLFYNIPARRNFLKSNSVELRHIIDEFQRQALAHPDIFFSLHHDSNELYHLPASNLKQRIVNLFSSTYNERLVPVEESTEMVAIQGFIGKPQFAKKTRGEQFFFVNKRFVKDAYLNHAVINAFEGLLTEQSFPLYVLFIEIDPARIDINVHPTKTEIKFEDDKTLYAIIRAAVKRALGRYHVSPTIDFDVESGLGNIKPFNPLTDEVRIPTIAVNPDFNPFKTDSEKKQSTHSNYKKDQTENWQELYKITEKQDVNSVNSLVSFTEDETKNSNKAAHHTYQLHNRYIISPVKTGFMLIDQQAAHERILYERFKSAIEKNQGLSQQCLFPRHVELNPSDFELIKNLLEDLRQIGFDIHEFGKNTFVIHGIPAEIENDNEEELLHGILEDYKQNLALTGIEKQTNLARSLAKNASIKAGHPLSHEEMKLLIDQLFACELPQVGINGKATLFRMTFEELTKRLDKIN